MKTIDNDIKTGQFKQIYLLYGEEQYLIRQYRDKLKHALAADDDTMNFSAFSGSDINQKEIIDLAETLPFFADRRLILIEDSGLFKKSAEELADYMSSIPETTYFVFAEKEIDKKTKMYKQVKKNGSIVEFPRQNETTLSRWIEGRIRRNGKNITRDAYALFIRKTGDDMENIDKELEKLLCYTLEKDYIDISDVEAITTEQTENKIFDMIDAVALHQQKKALDLYYDLLALKEAPMRILFFAFQPVSASDDCQIHDQSGIWQQRNCFKSRLPGVGSPQISVAEPCFFHGSAQTGDPRWCGIRNCSKNRTHE